MRLLFLVTTVLALGLLGVPGLSDDGLLVQEARAEQVTGCVTGNGPCGLPTGPIHPPYDCVQDCDGPPDS